LPSRGKRQWHDLAAMTARVPDGARATGHGGVGYSSTR
jgi:hypothetical protein